MADSADTGTTTYNPVGQVTSVVDDNGATLYVYDGQDADGVAEYRGLVTQVKVKLTGGTEYTSTAAYDHAGALVTEKLPGRIIRRTTLDLTGDQTNLAVNGQAVDPDTSTFVDDQPWLGWSTTSDISSRIIREWTPSSAAGYTGSDYVVASDRHYTYDQAGRLTTVNDWTGNPDPDTGTVPCTTRTYTFDNNGNRTAQAERPAASDGTCTTAGGTTATRTYDTADRPTTGANNTGTYTYDQLGRQTTIPAIDAPHAGSGNISLGYYDTDNIRTITQSGETTTFTLDGANRRLGQTTAGGSSTATLIRHYTDSSDNPSWSVGTRGSTTTTTRYADLINGDLGLTLTSGGTVTTAELAIGSPRDDMATVVTLPIGSIGPNGTAANGIDDWSDYSEYGVPSGDAVGESSGGVAEIGYRWLGGKERSTVSTGLTLLGSRLFNGSSGQFATVDPVPDGGSTKYAYPTDPINTRDLDGRCWRNAWNGWRCWQQSRTVGRIAEYAARATGGRCYWSYGMRTCSGSRIRLYGGSGTTYGNTFISRDRNPSRITMGHEKVHRTQWNRYGYSFAFRYGYHYVRARVRYGRGYGGCNIFEYQAGWRAGNYGRCLGRRPM